MLALHLGLSIVMMQLYTGWSCKFQMSRRCQNVPSLARVAASDFGFLTLIHVFDGPDL